MKGDEQALLTWYRKYGSAEKALEAILHYKIPKPLKQGKKVIVKMLRTLLYMKQGEET